jgi:predicted Na+-dependent transporter
MKLFKIISQTILFIITYFVPTASFASIRNRNNPSPKIHISVSACCLETEKLILEEQDIHLTINLDNIPLYPINITLYTEDNFKYFNVSTSNIYFPSGYETIALANNTEIQVEVSNYELYKKFTLKKLQSGKSKLSFNISSENTNISYDKNINNSITINVLNNILTIPVYLIIIATFFFIFSTGLSLSGYTLKKMFTSKESVKPVICGVLLQFVITPLLAGFIILVFRQSNYQSFSVFLVSISPGSIVAPIFTYYIGGDRALAVSLCLVTTILGSILYPYYMWIYFAFSRIGIEMFRFNYVFLLLIVIYLLLPLTFGVLIQHYQPLIASWLKKSIPLWGAITIVTSLVVAIKDYADIFVKDWRIYSISIILTSASLALSALTSKLFKLDSQKTRTICLNTALPNIPLAITILQCLLVPTCAQVLQAYPLFHLFWMIIENIIICVIIYFFFPLIEDINETSEQKFQPDQKSMSSSN